MPNKNILIVDDDAGTLRLLESALSSNGYNVFKSTSGEEALAVLENQEIHLVLLDVVLPGIDGLETLKKIRSHALLGYIPVLILTCHNSEIDNVLGLELGADDYLGKPIRFHELMARIKAVLRRTASHKMYSNHKLIIGTLEIDFITRTAMKNGYDLQLSYKEFEILALLAKKSGKVFSREEIMNNVWSEDFLSETRTVDVHIRRIRKKVEECGQNSDFIETIRSVGYRLSALP